MKTRYDVSGWMGIGMRFSDQREAFELAKKIDAKDKLGEAIMMRMVWDEKGRITLNTVAVKASGEYRRIN